MSLAVPDGSTQSHAWLSSGSEHAMEMLPGERCCLQDEQGTGSVQRRPVSLALLARGQQFWCLAVSLQWAEAMCAPPRFRGSFLLPLQLFVLGN